MVYIKKGAQTKIGRKMEELAQKAPAPLSWLIPDPYSDPTGGFMLGMPFSRIRTDFPVINEMLKKPQYFASAKRVIAKVVDMSPWEYLKQALKGFQLDNPKMTMKDVLKVANKDLVKEYAEKLKIEEFPMPHLDYRYGFGQEGRHRALAAHKNKMKKIPVVIVENLE